MNIEMEEEAVIAEHDLLETAFEIRAWEAGVSAVGERLHRLRLMHLCAVKERGIETEMDLSWVRCPWCSKRIPERIRRIFRQ